MLNSVVRLEVYKKTAGESDYDAVFEDTPIVVTDFNSVTSVFGIEQVKDTVKFTIPIENLATPGNNIVNRTANTYNIEIGDLVKLYAYNSPMQGSLDDHIIMVCYIKNWSMASAQGEGSISFTAYNRSEILLNNFIFITENTGDKVPNMLVQAINRIKTFNQTDVISAYKDYSGLAQPGDKGAYNEGGQLIAGKTGYLRAYKDAAYDADGNLIFGPTDTIPTTQDADGRYIYYFEDSVFVETYKPFVDHLDDLSTTKYTGDVNKGAYIYYVDDENNLHWHPKRFVNTSSKDGEVLTINEFEESAVSMSKDMNDVVNAVIVNCGPDPNEAGILSFAFDASSMGKNGAKWKYVAKVDIADAVREDEIKSGDWTLDDGTSKSGNQNSPKYIGEDNYPSSYPWTIQTSGSDIFGNWIYTGSSTTVSTNSEYREYFRNVTKELGKSAGDKVVEYGSEPIFKGKYELEIGTNNYVAGDLIKIVIPSIGINTTSNVQLRIMSINHDFTGGVWSTTLDLQEDRDLNLLGY